MRKSNFLMLLLALVVFTFSCQQQDVAPNNETPVLSQDVQNKLWAHGINPTVAKYVDNVNPLTGETVSGWLFGGDMFVAADKLEDIYNGDLSDHKGLTGEQYRTTNLVSVSGSVRTISVIGYTGGSFALTSKMRTGLQQAINHYNSKNLRLRFTLTFATSTNADIVVYRVSGGAGGSAGFPSGGNPYKWVRINSGTDSFSTGVNRHVITHEIGHCIGFRHTDYFNRSISCGSGGNEGSAGVGAIHIPGTPTTNVNANTSVMNACFNSGSTGVFTSSDNTALNFLY